MYNIQLVKNFLLTAQENITQTLLQEEPKHFFIHDPWQEEELGEGITKVLTNGVVFEKAAVNFSHVKGNSLPNAATLKRPELINCAFEALGLSSVIHPFNPYIPTAHANFRLITVKKISGEDAWWFGGGFDLTPFYGFVEDCVYWHSMAKKACEMLDQRSYPQFKKNCDAYFYLPHRNEARGIGGIFFDDLNECGFNTCFAFIKKACEHFIEAYATIVKRRKKASFGAREKEFQLIRRGRYVEFNLLYDRGTLFGLQSKGRIESILVSLPPLVKWVYNDKEKINEDQENLFTNFLQQKAWI